MVLKNFIWVIVQFKCDEKPKSIPFPFFFKTESLSVSKPFKSSRILHIRLDAWKNYKRCSIADRCYHYRFAAACFPILVLTISCSKGETISSLFFSMPIFPSNPSFSPCRQNLLMMLSCGPLFLHPACIYVTQVLAY